MGTLAQQALADMLQIKDSVQRLSDEIKEGKATVHSDAALQILTNIQAQMFTVKADVMRLHATVAAAQMTGQLDPIPRTAHGAPYADRQCAAAHDDTFNTD